MTAGIIYYYSIYLVTKNLKLNEDNEIEEEQDSLGTFAIEDFDVAIKYKNPSK